MRACRFIAAVATASTLACAGVGLGAVVPGTALSALPAGATASDETSLLALTNQARASVGAPALSLDAGISAVARSWAQTMAAQGDISHNPDMGSMISGWSRLAENVGVGSSINQVHDALLASHSHYVNLSDPAYSQVGIGVVSAGGRLYVVEDFEAPAGDSRASAVVDPGPPPTVAPRAPTTTSPPPPEAPRPPPVAVAPAPAPTPAVTVSTFHFVLDALRALESW